MTKRKLVDKLCQNWSFDKQNFNNILITVNGKEYSRKIYNAPYPEYAYIIFNKEKYYFEKGSIKLWKLKSIKHI